ncbi:MAG: hypothetical protein J3R72DRAFT_528837 [Linnemannia gamsii]|nr:MAG: hypothetical protein J3R72DRAFT_528837 [Linnemannia gamsii]
MDVIDRLELEHVRYILDGSLMQRSKVMDGHRNFLVSISQEAPVLSVGKGGFKLAVQEKRAMKDRLRRYGTGKQSLLQEPTIPLHLEEIDDIVFASSQILELFTINKHSGLDLIMPAFYISQGWVDLPLLTKASFKDAGAALEVVVDWLAGADVSSGNFLFDEADQLELSFGGEAIGASTTASQEGTPAVTATPVTSGIHPVNMWPRWSWDWHLPHLETLELTSEFAQRFQHRVLHGCPS